MRIFITPWRDSPYHSTLALCFAGGTSRFIGRRLPGGVVLSPFRTNSVSRLGVTRGASHPVISETVARPRENEVKSAVDSYCFSKLRERIKGRPLLHLCYHMSIYQQRPHVPCCIGFYGISILLRIQNHRGKPLTEKTGTNTGRIKVIFPILGFILGFAWILI